MKNSLLLPQNFQGQQVLQAAILKEIASRKSRRETQETLRSDFAAFVRASWHVVEPAKPLIDNWHIDAIAIHLQAVAEGRIRNLMINIGPGYAKSIIASVMFSAWLWVRNPQTRIIAATYSASLSNRDSMRTRELVTSEWFQDVFAPKWSMVKVNEDFISNTESGSRLALSVGGKATGFRADGQIFDDLLNATDKHSEAARTSAREWAISTMSTRFNDMRIGWRVVIGQRLHEDDPYGSMLATGDYIHLCLPSEFETKRACTTSIGWKDPRTEEGQLLFPELFNRAVLEQQKKDLGSYDYAGQHQQRPSPAEGGLFKRSWWRRFTKEELPSIEMVVISVDATFKEAGDVDYVAIHVYGFSGPRCFLLARRHERMGFTATKHSIRVLYDEFRPSAILVEDKANGSAIIEELSREIPGVIAINPEGGKIARAWAASPTVEAGGVYLPAHDFGAEEVIEEAAAFPNGRHDDDVDALTQALNWQRTNNDLSVWARLGSFGAM
jgi:predicted phage terminase large subunit-like protein